MKYGATDLAAPVRSGFRQVGGLRAARIRLDVEIHALSFAQNAKAGGLHGRGMNKHVLAAALGRDESEAFAGIEELNGANGHVIFL